MNFQIKMLTYNPLAMIITPEAITRNGEFEVLYDVTNFTAISAKSLTTAQVLQLLNETASTVQEGIKYMLSPASFILEEDFIFIESASRRFRFIYCNCSYF